MRATATASVTFEAGHTVPNDTLCEEPNHGHRWVISVGVEHAVDHGDLLSALSSVVDEFAGRNLNDMLPGVIPSPTGLGLYVHERLSLDWRKITKIEVSMGPNTSVLIEWELRL